MPHTILVVDDCFDIAQILSRHLASAGHRVMIARDGKEALEMLAREIPDCVFLDLMMPGMTGVELMHHLRATPATADLPVVLVSARVGQGRTHVLSEGDANHCVPKPFTRRQVLSALRAVLGDEPLAAAAR